MTRKTAGYGFALRDEPDLPSNILLLPVSSAPSLFPPTAARRCVHAVLQFSRNIAVPTGPGAMIATPSTRENRRSRNIACNSNYAKD
jgi:hypothetical protein